MSLIKLSSTIATLGAIRSEDSRVAFESKRVYERLGMPKHALNQYRVSERNTLNNIQHSSHQWTALFLSYYNVTQMTISVEK